MCIRSASWTDLARDCEYLIVSRPEEAALCSRAGSEVCCCCCCGGGGGGGGGGDSCDVRARLMELVEGNGGPIGIWNGISVLNEKADWSRLM